MKSIVIILFIALFIAFPSVATKKRQANSQIEADKPKFENVWRLGDFQIFNEPNWDKIIQSCLLGLI